MKIDTITCQHVYNYGATLQAYALQYYLESLGNEVEIISYQPEYQFRYDCFHIDKNRKAYRLFHRCKPLVNLFALYYNRGMRITKGRKLSFDAFDKKYLHLTSLVYHNIDDLRRNSPLANVYIAGSDQIWNTDMPNGTDPSYYLDFGSSAIKKISYAASFGISHIALKYEHFVKQGLSHFSFLSVRELTGLTMLNELGYQGTCVVDPVFLLSAKTWKDNLSLKLIEKEYIFLYDFMHNNNELRKFALKLKEETNLPLVSINDFSEADYADIQINNAGPEVFLDYILNAKYVVSESFHATAFSIIFHKNFVVYPLVEQNNESRLTDFLNSFGLLSRFMPNGVCMMKENVDWKDIDKKLCDMVQMSFDFFKQVLR